MGVIPHLAKQPFCPDLDVQPIGDSNQVSKEGFVFFFGYQVDYSLSAAAKPTSELVWRSHNQAGTVGLSR